MSRIPNVVPLGLTLDAEGRIQEDVACLRCGYNLRGLDPNQVCPECGTPVGRSAHGDLLRFCDPAWVGQLASGMNWIVAGIVCSIVIGGVLGILLTASGRPGAQGVMLVVGMATGLITLIGYWKVTIPDPGKPEERGQFNARLVARWVMVVNFCIAPIQVYLQRLSPRSGAVFGVVAGVIGLAGMVALFTYARQLAQRIPDPLLAGRVRIVMWGLVAATILALAVGIVALNTMTTFATATSAPAGAPTSLPAPAMAAGAALGGLGCASGLAYLVFGIWAVLLILRFRKAFDEASRHARQTWAAPTSPTPS